MTDEKRIMKAAEGRVEVRIVSIILLLFSIVCIVFDLLLTKSFLQSNQPLTPNAETMVILIAYATTLFAFIASIVGLRGKHPKTIVTFGIILLVFGVASAIAAHVYTGRINHAYVIVGLLGGVMVSGGLKLLSTFHES